MDEVKEKVIATGKVALGVGRIVSGVLTAAGHGIIGTYCRNHHMMSQAARIAKSSIEGGSKMVKDGWEALND